MKVGAAALAFAGVIPTVWEGMTPAPAMVGRDLQAFLDLYRVLKACRIERPMPPSAWIDAELGAVLAKLRPVATAVPSLTREDGQVLLYLLEMHPLLRLQPDIEQGARLAHATVSDSLGRLRQAGYVHRPQGERKGSGLTDEGKKLAERCKELVCPNDERR
jgi:DNA-binding MarR family transcriptional regulator